MSPGGGRKEVVKAQAARCAASNWKVVGGHRRSLQVTSCCATTRVVTAVIMAKAVSSLLHVCTYQQQSGCVSQSNYTTLLVFRAAALRNSDSPPSPTPLWQRREWGQCPRTSEQFRSKGCGDAHIRSLCLLAHLLTAPSHTFSLYLSLPRHGQSAHFGFSILSANKYRTGSEWAGWMRKWRHWYMSMLMPFFWFLNVTGSLKKTCSYLSSAHSSSKKKKKKKSIYQRVFARLQRWCGCGRRLFAPSNHTDKSTRRAQVAASEKKLLLFQHILIFHSK